MRRVIVCGGERSLDPEKAFEIFERLVLTFGEDGFRFVVAGVRTEAEQWAKDTGIGLDVVKGSDWRKQHEQMVEHADLVVAFPGGRRREQMVQAARAADVEVWETDLDLYTFEDESSDWTFESLEFKKEELHIKGVEKKIPIVVYGRIGEWYGIRRVGRKRRKNGSGGKAKAEKA